MNLSKSYKVVEFSDVEYGDSTIVFSISFDASSKRQYTVVIPESWQENRKVVSELFPMVLCVYAMGFRAVARKVVLPTSMVLNPADEDFLRGIFYHFYSALVYSSGSFLNSLGSIGELVYRHRLAPAFTQESNVSVAIKGYKEKSVALGFSGGKESSLCYGLYSDMNFDIHPLTVLNTARVPEYSFEGIDNIEYAIEDAYPWDAVFEVTGFDHWYPSISTLRMIYTAIHGVVNGCTHIVNGNEFNRTELLMGEVSKGVSHGTNFGQSNFMMAMIRRWLYYRGYTCFVYSPLQNMSEVLEEVILWKYYPKLAEQQVSCFSLMVVDGKLKPCGSCPKCLRMSTMMAAIQNVSSFLELPPFVGSKFQRGVFLPISFGSKNSTEEVQCIEDMLRGDITEVVMKVLKLRFDELHRRDFVPKEVMEFIENNLIKW